jgi:hypothetical protein
MSKAVKKSKFPLFLVIVVAAAAVLAYALFFAFPDAEAIKTAMAKEDFNVFSDITKDTPLLGALLPEGSTRSLVFTKTLNGDSYLVEVIYFNDFSAAKTYYEGLEAAEEGNAQYLRGNSVIKGTLESAKSLRWLFWAF